MKIIFNFFQNLFSFFYPRSCPACHHALQQHEQVICSHCLIHLPETDYHLFEDNPLQNTFAGRVKIEQVVSLLFYRKGNHTQQILHNLKYKGNKELGYYLGKYYGEKLSSHPIISTVDYIVPIPLHPDKLKKRGYNQSECFAQGLGEKMGKECATDVLIRVSNAGTQTKKSRINRWENVKDAFEIADEEKLQNAHVLLCDDVLTTGATIEAAAAKLLNEKGVKVSVATLASTI